MSSRRRVLIVGSTPLALLLALQWVDEGHRVTVLDRPGADFSAFPGAMSGQCIIGDPLEAALSRPTGIEETDVLVAATPDDDLNLATAIACHETYDVAQAFAVVDDPKKAGRFAKFGIHVLCPTSLVGAIILRSVNAAGGR